MMFMISCHIQLQILFFSLFKAFSLLTNEVRMKTRLCYSYNVNVERIDALQHMQHNHKSTQKKNNRRGLRDLWMQGSNSFLAHHIKVLWEPLNGGSYVSA